MIGARRLSRALARLAVCAALLSPAAHAHDGPPYPILVDESLGDWTLSVWSDPDVGTGTFYYYVTPPSGRAADELRIQVISAPADGTSPEVTGFAEPAEPGEPFQQIGTLAFDHRGLWNTRFVLRVGAERAEILGELTYELDVTPPGLGPLDILWFAFPFLLIGGIWLRALLAQRAYDRGAAPGQSS